MVGMRRSEMETSREILNQCCGNVALSEEVGRVRSSEEASVMERGAKGPCLVSVNREAKDVRWLVNR